MYTEAGFILVEHPLTVRRPHLAFVRRVVNWLRKAVRADGRRIGRGNSSSQLPLEATPPLWQVECRTQGSVQIADPGERERADIIGQVRTTKAGEIVTHDPAAMLETLGQTH